MPPKKRRRVDNPDSQPGVGRKHIFENYSTLPAADDLRNGHVLYMFFSSGEQSRAKTERCLKAHYSPLHDIQRSLDADVKRLLSQTVNSSSFQRLTCHSEFEHFKAICNEHFTVDLEPVSPLATPGSSGEVPVVLDVSTTPAPDGPEAMPAQDRQEATPAQDTPDVEATSTGRSTRASQQLTPRKASMRRRLDFLAESSVKLKKKHRSDILQLKSQLKTPKAKGVLNQAIKRKIDIIKRKNDHIQELKRKLLKSKQANELAQTKNELTKLKEAHRKLLQNRKKKKVPCKKGVSFAKYESLKKQIQEKNEVIADLQHQNLLLQESVEELQLNSPIESRVDGRTYSSSTRMKVFDCIVNNVPTKSIPVIIEQFNKRSGPGNNKDQQVPQRSTVELMAREIGAIAELQAAEVILENKDSTIGFDATTQEGVHINEVHFTTSKECVSAAVNELAGGTAEDYAGHICQTVNTLAETYTYFTDGSNYQETRSRLIKNISNSMSDRCASNHAALRLVNSEWKKTLNELNCHLHPLDSIASATRAALKKLEETRGQIKGTDCLAANVVIQMSKLRYKDGKGNPRGFVTFLDRNNLPRCILPRYRGNRLHILYHNAGVLIEHYNVFTEMLKGGHIPGLGGLRSCLLQDLTNDVTRVELQVLGLLGKHLTGPWMKRFYTSATSEINHVDGITVVRGVIESLREMMQEPQNILTATTDFFGSELVADSTLEKLRAIPSHPLFNPMMLNCLRSVIEVLERQYSKYFAMDITEKLREETASARSHNIDSEEIMGMFSAAQKKSPNATLCFLSSRMRAIKNKTVAYLDNLSEKRRDEILMKAVKYGRLQRNKRRKKQKELHLELVTRQKQKEQQKDTADRKKLESILKKSGIEGARNEFPNMSDRQSEKLADILNGKIIGQRICHVWAEDNEVVVYNGIIRKLYANKMYKVGYWSKSEDLDDAVDYNVSMFEFASDFMRDDLVFSD